MLILTLLIITFAMSFLFSGSEIGFTRLNQMLVDVWVKNRRVGARLTRWFVVNPENFLSTTLVGNNIAVTTFTTLAVVYFAELGFTRAETFILSALLIILFTEIVPKIIFQHYHNQLFPGTSLPVGLFFLLFLPVVITARLFSVFLARLAGSADTTDMTTFYRNSFKAIFHAEFDAQLLNKEALAIIHNVVELSERTAKEVLTPRVDIIALPEETPLAEAIPMIVKSGFSKFPVFQEDVDHINGYVTARDFFKRPAVLKDIVRPVEFFPEGVSVQTLLKAFDQRQLNLVVILDEYGGTAGIITHEDLAEELFGDIHDEYDPEVVWIRTLDDNRWLINTRMELDDFFRVLNRPQPEGNWETVGGWIIDRHDGIPYPGEKLAIDGLNFQVARGTRRRLISVILEHDAALVEPPPATTKSNSDNTKSLS
ncbi:MAG: HlyC/CorC family transporter [Candidatus Delongbacteria bacterium]|nr:HlyC/CorC family transporter [Candidatus Delongbacteria bacterium]